MKFLVHKTSLWTKDCPYDKATKETWVEKRGGKDHELTGWFIELNSLEELSKFAEEVDEELVFDPKGWKTGGPTLEIYDTYRE